ncbi:hypothetical protein [Halocynthiibacter styelae]|uniref:Uncharacterized protein n=1 Tax=Halocynthiibacter styelae TaxID=2761955 RepID=A0A8J7IC76_9RHOB|nr:hypothetical protein [Paenihalocynthiibacter styelae]MBI1492404.1 hypothetical protein [Paenihalocynthiibacter styelae]
MTNFSAIAIITLLILSMIVDAVFFDSYGTVYMLKKIVDLREWVAFWR